MLSSEASLLTRVNPFHARGTATVALGLGVHFNLPAKRFTGDAYANRGSLTAIAVGEGVCGSGSIGGFDAKVAALDAAVDEKFRGSGVAHGRSMRRSTTLATHRFLQAIEMGFVGVWATNTVARGSVDVTWQTQRRARKSNEKGNAKCTFHEGLDSL